MTAQGSSLETVAEVLGTALQPLSEFMSSNADIHAYIAGIGWNLPSPLPPSFAALQGSLDSIAASLAELAEQREAVADGSADEGSILTKLGEVLVGVLVFTADLKGLPEHLRTELPAAYVSESQITDGIQRRIFDDALVRSVEDLAPLAHAILLLLGFLEAEPREAAPAHHQPAFIERRIRLDLLPTFFSDPLSIYRDIYGWGTSSLDAERLFRALQRVSYRLLIPAEIQYPSLALVSAVAPGSTTAVADGPDPMLVVPLVNGGGLALDLGVLPVPKASSTELQGLAITLKGDAKFSASLPIAANLAIGIDATLDITTGVALVVRPDAPPSFTDGLGGASPLGLSGHAMVRLIYGRADGEPSRLLSIPGGSRFEIGSMEVGVGVGDTGGKIDVMIEAALKDARLVITMAGADGFLARLLPSDGITIKFDFGVAWSQSGGLRFSGGAMLETTFALGLTLGPLHVDSVTLALVAGAPGIRLDMAITGGATLGPVAASIDKIGLRSQLAFNEGNLGPVSLGFDFKPPTGLGIVVDAGPVTGGGFISFDPDNGRYAGVLQLKIYSIGVTAIGLLDTKLPGGKSGFSFLIIIAVEFTPIQLGFGFTLNGIGGLAGINRTLVADALRQGVRQHTLDDILFPQDPVARAAQLISDLGHIFPPAEGRYVFGPMIKIGWATFVEAELGIIIELPSPVRIAILGRVDVFFPEKHAAIIEIHLDVLGIIDFGEKLFSLDASLYDSRVLLFSLSGDMAMRLSWGDNPSFAFSIGGLNPHFQPPPKFPTLRRLTLSVGYGDYVRLSLEAYFALTSNSLQFGAALRLSVDLGALHVHGLLGFDALFIFSPFSFIIDFEAGVDVSVGSLSLCAIHVKGTLSGPTPWHVVGDASVSLLFFDISVHVEFTAGDEKHEELSKVDTWAPLKSATEATTSWSAARPPAALEVVKLAPPEGSSAPVLIDPAGGATLRERVLPINQRITRFAERAIAPIAYTLDHVILGDPAHVPPQIASTTPVYDHFAPAQFRDLSDAEKISGPSFVDMPAGFTLAGDAIAFGGGVGLAIKYTTKILDSKDQSRATRESAPSAEALLAAARSRTAGTGLRAAGLLRYAPDSRLAPRAAIDEETFLVAERNDLRPRPEITTPVNKGLAQSALAAHIAANPQDRSRLLVVPAADVNGV